MLLKIRSVEELVQVKCLEAKKLCVDLMEINLEIEVSTQTSLDNNRKTSESDLEISLETSIDASTTVKSPIHLNKAPVSISHFVTMNLMLGNYQPPAQILSPIVIVFLRMFAQTATAGSDVVQSGRPIFDDFFQHLWPYIGNNTANVVFQMVKRLWLIRIDQ
ncbi:hypothetical protein TNCV_4697431 [Trichonephila clavipes]|nr:hypothetical protein TNCV_4697431 [Trichonephila clavipes]